MPAAAVTARRVLHLDGYEGPAAVAAARAARAAGIPVSLDAEEATECREELFPLTDILIVSHRFAQRLTEAARVPGILDAIARLGPRLVGVTLGADGSAVRYGGRTVGAAGFAVDVVDTTGAGDVFHGTFLAGLLWRWPLAQILRFANTVAALACTRLGGQAGIRPSARPGPFSRRGGMSSRSFQGDDDDNSDRGSRRPRLPAAQALPGGDRHPPPLVDGVMLGGTCPGTAR